MSAAALATDAAERLVRRAGLAARELPAELAQAVGSWREQPVRLAAQAWNSQRLSWVRLVTIEPHVLLPERPLSIGNLLAVGRPELALPVLGLDVVHVRPGEVVVASDLVPTDSDAQDSADPSPRWAQGFFSAEARVVRVPPEELPQQRAPIELLVEQYLEQLERAQPNERALQAGARQAEYLALHRREDPGLRLLGVMFGEAWAARFLAEVMFPETLP